MVVLLGLETYNFQFPSSNTTPVTNSVASFSDSVICYGASDESQKLDPIFCLLQQQQLELGKIDVLSVQANGLEQRLEHIGHGEPSTTGHRVIVPKSASVSIHAGVVKMWAA